MYLNLQPYKQNLVEVRKQLKLSPKCFGPFEILQKIGKVAYILAFPPAQKYTQYSMCWKLGTTKITSTNLHLVGSEDQFILEPLQY